MENRLKVLSRLLCLVMAMAFVFGAVPVMAEKQYGYVTMDKSLFRKSPKSSDYWAYLDAGWAAEIIGQEKYGKHTFYKVVSNTPKHLNKKYTGFLREDVFRPMTPEEQAAYVKTLESPGSSGGSSGSGSSLAPSVEPTGYVKITQVKTNLRNAPDGESLAQLDKGLIVPYYGAQKVRAGHRWVYVYVEKGSHLGYVRSDCYEFVNKDGSAALAPGDSIPDLDFDFARTLALVSKDGSNLRQTPHGYAVTALLRGTLVELTGPLESGWYPVKYKEYNGYILASSLRILTDKEKSDYISKGILPPLAPDLPEGVDTAKPDGKAKVLIQDSPLRDMPSGSSILLLAKDEELSYFGSAVERDSVKWQFVFHTPSSKYGYVRADNIQYTSGTPGGLAAGYIKLIKDKVFFRKTPNGEHHSLLPIDSVLVFTGKIEKKAGYDWAEVKHDGKTGYIRKDCYIYSDASGKPIGGAPATPKPPSAALGKIRLIKGGVNLRAEAGGKVIARLNRGTELPYFAMTSKDGYRWYYVLSEKGNGYIRADMAKEIDSTSLPGPIPLPSENYVMTTHNKINLREKPFGKTLAQVPKQNVFKVEGAIEKNGRYNWYPVIYNSIKGYLRGDFVRLLSAEEANAFVKHGTIPPVKPGGSSVIPSSPSEFMQITVAVSNLRVAPSVSAAVLKTANKEEVIPYITLLNSGGKLWMVTQIGSQYAYLLSSDAKIMTKAEYEQWKKDNTISIPTPPPATEEQSNIAVTTAKKVNIRKAASMASPVVTQVFKKGDRIELLGEIKVAESHAWHKTKANGVEGWVRGDYIRILSKAEAGLSGGSGGSGSDKPTASYRTLRKGMTGDDVKRLQNELIKLKFMPAGTATGVYDSRTERAVRQYQAAAGLFVDGIAGQKTQDKLYGTQPPGSSTPGDSSIYPVEKVDWYTGDIQKVWAKGRVAKLTDVKTGISFNVKRWSGGFHSDVEPLKTADTDQMCRVYGVRHAQQISDKNLYQRRPVWITIDGRTFAASMYGVPHNYPEGDTIPDNSFNGQFCVHFVNSKLHRNGKVDADHQAAIQYAYNHAPKKK